jgi:hypothetical protein
MIFICLTRKEATDMHPEAQDQSSRPVQSTTQPNPIMEANERNGTGPATETGRTRARGSGLYDILATVLDAVAVLR